MEGKTGVRDTHEQIRVIERGMRGSKGEREGGERGEVREGGVE